MATSTQHTTARPPRVSLAYELDGDPAGQPIVLLPSLGRAPSDFDTIAGALAADGFLVVRPWPRGMGESRGPLEGLTLDELAEDVLAVIRAATPHPPIVAGHAFGNFVARRLAALHPGAVRGVALLAASAGKTESGEAPIAPDLMASIYASSDLALPDAERLLHLRKAFFAPGNRAEVWLGGWYPEAKRAQGQAYAQSRVDDYFAAGGVPLLDLQAEHDTIAPRRFATMLSRALGEQVTVRLVPRAGHALLPEQPMAVHRALRDWARQLAPLHHTPTGDTP